MANSITASTVSPFSGLLLQDVNYNVSASFPVPTLLGAVTGSTTSINYANLDYPTVGKFIVQLNINSTNASAATPVTASLLESSDNVNFNQIAVFSTTMAGNSGTGSTSVQVLLTPQAKPFLKAWVSIPASGSASGTALTGTYGITTLF